MPNQMQIFSAVGPLGAGKTTLTIHTIEAMIQAGMTSKSKCAYVINDEGANVDGSLIERSAKVLPMTSGCFTCSDEAELRKALDQLYQQQMEWVFLEGFGMTSGNETKKFLKSVPYPFRIICVLDFRNHERNLVRYADVIKSQVHAATIGTGITKYGDASTLMDLPDSDVLDFVAKHSHGKPAFLIPEGSFLPLDLLAASVVGQSVASSSTAHDACSHAGHDHGHHHHVHTMNAYSYELRKETKFSEVVAAFQGCSSSIWRLKGAVEGKLFNAVFDDWRQTMEDQRSFVTFYSKEEILLGRDLVELAKLILPETEVGDNAQSYQMIRSDGITEEETIAEIRRLMDEIPTEAILLSVSEHSVRLITHPETLQILKEISRRSRIKETWFPLALKRCMEYWIRCAGVLKERKDEILPPDLPVNQRELGVSLAWWLTYYGVHFGDRISTDTKTLKVGEMVAKGILALSSLNSDPEKAYWQCQEILCAAKLGLANGEDRELITKAVKHCFSLSQGTSVQGEWEKAYAQLA